MDADAVFEPHEVSRRKCSQLGQKPEIKTRFKGENVQQVERKQDHRHSGCGRWEKITKSTTADVASTKKRRDHQRIAFEISRKKVLKVFLSRNIIRNNN